MYTVHVNQGCMPQSLSLLLCYMHMIKTTDQDDHGKINALVAQPLRLHLLHLFRTLRNRTTCIHLHTCMASSMDCRCGAPYEVDSVLQYGGNTPANRELKQTTTTMVTRTPPNKRLNEQNNGCARVL